MHIVLDSAFHRLIEPAAQAQQIGAGFQFTEGPVWNPAEGFLFFSDIPGNARYAWDPQSGVSEIQSPNHKGNGMTYDADLNLLVCEHETSRVVRLATDGAETVVADMFEGRSLNSPNDIVLHSDGSIWFTDPTYGRMAGVGLERPVELGFQGVYRIPPGGGEPQLMVNRTTFTQPNGLTFDPSERYLYVNDTEQANIRRFDVGAKGRLSNERIIASGISDPERGGVPDGLKCDAEGNIWCTGPGGIWVYSAAGVLLGKIVLPELCANFHWGGPDWRTLFCTASTSVYTLPVKIGPRTEPFMHALTSAPDKPSLGKPALLIQDMQNDVVMAAGAFAESGAPDHCRSQNCIAHIAALAATCRAKGIPVIHIHFVVDPGAPGLTQNAPLFQGVREANALVRGTWGAAPVDALRPEPGDYVVEKSRMSPWEVTGLDMILRAHGIDTLINAGAWTNMAVEHTARTGADRGYRIVMAEDATATMNADWQRAAIDYALQNIARITTTNDLLAELEEL